jgi:hypothetical protein
MCTNIKNHTKLYIISKKSQMKKKIIHLKYKTEYQSIQSIICKTITYNYIYHIKKEKNIFARKYFLIDE